METKKIMDTKEHTDTEQPNHEDQASFDVETQTVYNNNRLIKTGKDDMPGLDFSKSVLNTVRVTSEESESVAFYDTDSGDSSSGDQSEDFWITSHQMTHQEPPPIQCSLFTVIGEPSIRKRLAHKQEMKEKKSKWAVSTYKDWRINTVDMRTIYSKSQDDLLNVITQDTFVLPPLDCSPRLLEIVPDSQDFHEKVLVLKNHFSMGPKTHYRKDKMVLPNVYSDYFGHPDMKQKYINSMWNKYKRSKVKYSQELGPHNKSGDSKVSCTYCDVIGSKYCQQCREFQNRKFAITYEDNFLPNIDSRMNSNDRRRTLVAPRVDTALVAPLTDVISKKRKKRHGASVSKKSNTRLVMPVTYIPLDEGPP